MGVTREAGISGKGIKKDPCTLACRLLVFIELYDIDFFEPANKRYRHNECHPNYVGLSGEDGQHTNLSQCVSYVWTRGYGVPSH